MLLYFWPRDRTFWLYHCSVLLLVSVIQGLIIYFWREKPLFNTVGSLIWLPLYTLGVLAFRSHYRRYQWQRLAISRLVILSLAYTFAVGLFVTVTLMATTLPFFWKELFSPEVLEEHNTSVAQQMTQLLVGNVLSTQLFAAAWVFIYISVTSNRRIREAELHNLKLENSLKEARLTSLAGQLNPHFLFNSLNNIRFMIHENPDHADHTITALSEILRYSLESGRKDKVPLEQELSIVRRYLEVMELQLDRRLKVNIAAPDTLVEYLIPPMSLHMLVENAIKHGIEHIRGTGLLEISVQDLGQALRLSVSNPTPAKGCDSAHSTGTGLANIEQRLQLLYGDAAGLTIDRDQYRFTATIILPKES